MSGMFGVVSDENCISTLFFGTDYHSHLGTQRGGLAVLGETFTHHIHDITQAQFKSKFPTVFQEMTGTSGIGVISDNDPQPLTITSRAGTFAIATAGLIENKDALAEGMLSEGNTFEDLSTGGINSVELAAKIISQGSGFVDGIQLLWSMIHGSASVLLLTREGLYAARDSKGRSPLVIAECDGCYAVATEACSFYNLGYRVVRYLRPGEIVRVTADGVEVKVEGGEHHKICSFLWIYTGYPASSYEGINVETVRERCGRALAKDDHIQADLAAGVPDSGTAHAVGYAMGSGLPFRRPLVKYTPGYGRSYTPVTQDIRDHIAKMKLIAVPDVINGNSIVLCEDSIVRGTQLKNFTVQKLRENGARQIHVRPACPPLMFPCPYALSTRKVDELAARRAVRDLEGTDHADLSPYLDAGTRQYEAMVEWIRKDLDITTLRYLKLDEMVEAIGLPEERLCLHCWRGRE